MVEIVRVDGLEKLDVIVGVELGDRSRVWCHRDLRTMNSDDRAVSSSLTTTYQSINELVDSIRVDQVVSQSYSVRFHWVSLAIVEVADLF